MADWTLLNNGWPANTGNGVAGATQIGRLELAVAPSDTQTLYAMVSSTNLGSGILAIYKTTDGGDSWSTTTIPSGAGSQMWYDAGLTVSPTDPDVVFLSAVDLYRSLNGGSSWTNLTQAYSGGPVHPDNHARAIVGGDANHVLNGNDGGVYYVDNALTATSAFNANWIALNDTLPTIEMYHGDITANFANSASPGATAGFQDNGSASVVFSGDPGAGRRGRRPTVATASSRASSRCSASGGTRRSTTAQVYVSTRRTHRGSAECFAAICPGSERASFI